jgi:hypothetical protein
MPSSGMLSRVPLVRTDVSKDLVFLRSVRQLLVTANVVPSSSISAQETDTVTRRILLLLVSKSGVLDQKLRALRWSWNFPPCMENGVLFVKYN